MPLTRKALAIVLCLGVAPPAAAQDLDPVQALRLSAEMHDAALASGDAVLMLAAARLRRSVALDEIARAPADGARDVTDPDPYTAAAMLAAARELSGGDPAIDGLIADTEAEATKGVKSGRVYSQTTLPQGLTDTYPALVYEGGRFADVYVEGRGRADLNLYVRDAQGRLVCSDTDLSPHAHCGWTPPADAAFTIEVTNRGSGATAYKLVTN